MRFKSPSLIVFLFTCVASIAQNNDYFNLKEVGSYRFGHLLLSQPKDLVKFNETPSEFNFIEALKIEGNFDINPTLSKLSSFYDLKELNLKHFKGPLNEHTFDSCQQIEIIHLSLDEVNLDHLKFLQPLNKLQVIYLYINGRPESLNNIGLVPNCKEIHIIGDFLPKDLQIICDQLKTFNQLQTLGLSIDRITDLPLSISKYRMLGSLCLYDNLSVYTNNGIEDLNEDNISIIFNAAFDLGSAINIRYFSGNDHLSDFEKEYLTTVYKGEILDFKAENSDETDEKGDVIPFKKEFVPDFAITPEFKSPYPSIKPFEETFIINPTINNILYCQSGFKLSIAANSFVNTAGENLKENVYIKISQYNNPIDLFFAGLNPKAGNMQFNSKGVFNVKASAEKGDAILKQGYQMKAFLPYATDSSKSYFFDYESNTWQDLNFYNEVFANNFEAIDFYKIENAENTSNVYLIDTSSFDTRFNGKRNVYLNDRDINNQILFKKKQFYADLDRFWTRTYNQGGKMKGLKIKKGKGYIKIEKVIPKVRNKSRQYFKILDKTELLFPELKPMMSINFNILMNPDNKREFNDNFIKKTKYFDFRINYQKGRDYCEFVLKTNEGYKVLKAFITDSDDKELVKKQIAKFEKALSKYNAIKEKKSKEFNIFNLTRYNEYKTYNTKRHLELKKTAQYTEMKIHQLGTFAYAYQVEPVFSSNLIVQYTDLNGLPIDIKELFMVDSRFNSLIRIQAGNLNFDPATCQYIFATDYAGNLYYVNKNDVNGISVGNNSLIYLKMKKVNPNIIDIQSFNNLIRN